MELQFSSLLIVSVMIVVTSAYPTNVPPTPEVCSKMTPGHGPSPQSSSPPFEVDVSSNSVKGGNNVQVTLSGIDDSEFMGFYLQARDNNGSPLGTFIAADGVKTHGCGGIKNNAAHHAGKNLKESIVVFWQAPKDYTGTATFTATFVQSFEEFWTQVRSSPVSISNGFNSPLKFSRRKFITDSREKEEITKPPQENRVLNYNPYSPIPTSRNQDFVTGRSPFFYDNKSTPLSYPTTQVPASIRDPSSTTRIRKSFFIPKPKQAFELDPIPIHNHNNPDCNLSPYQHRFTSENFGSVITDPHNQNLPSYYNPNAFKQVPSTKHKSHGAGFLNLEGPNPQPILPQSVQYTENPSYYNKKNPYHGFRPSFFPSQYNSYSSKNQVYNGQQPSVNSRPFVEANRYPVIPEGHTPMYSTSPQNRGQHGYLIGDYLPSTGIVLPRDMQSYKIPKYGYLVFNPKRGPPYYLIPVEDSTAFEEAHNLGDGSQTLPQPVWNLN